MTEKDSFIGAEFTGTKEVSENLKFDEDKFQQWIDANIQSSGKILQIEQFNGGQSNPTYKITTENKKTCTKKKTSWKTSSFCTCRRQRIQGD
jgi:hypothetical protein